MIELSLSTIYAYRAGKWDLLQYAFVYDHINYSMYLTIVIGDMLSLEDDFPGVYRQCISGKFAAQFSSHYLSRAETDKVTEITLNKDTKTTNQYRCSQEIGDKGFFKLL